MKAIIFGCGYLGTRAAALLRGEGIEVYAVRRSPGELDHVNDPGFHPIEADITHSPENWNLPTAVDFVVNVSATGGGDAESYRQVYLGGNQNILAWLRNNPCRKFVYTSSTSVYGQNDGSWLDESSPTYPESETGKIIRESEKLVVGSAPQIPAVVLRLSGIYGPGRGHYLKKFRSGEPLAPVDANRFANMIHVQDAAAAIVRALKAGKPGELYNISDDEPTQLGEMFNWFAQKTNRHPPVILTSAPANDRKRGASNKRIANKKARTELDWNLKYPSYREGFTAELAEF